MLKTLLSLTIFVLVPALSFAAEGSKAMAIQKVVTPTGITAWLVESHSLPMISGQIAFRAGSAFDPNNKRGVANLIAGLLTQGAGELDARAFQKEKERLGANIGAGAGLLNITASFDTLQEVRDETFALFAKAIKNPTFDEADFKRLKQAVIAGRERVQENPRKLASEAFAEVVYGRYHPYSQPEEGTIRSLTDITPDDVAYYHKKMFTRANMVVSVVGAITSEELSALLERHFSDLPKGRKKMDIKNPPQAQPPVRRKIEMDIPQTTIVMGHEGLNRSVDDYFAALVANHILGGGGFSSRLMQEVREERGLVYGISSYFNPLPHHGAFRVVAQTKNESVSSVIDLVKKEIEAMRRNGVSEEMFADAISYLVGSFPLRLDSNADILSYLTFMQTEELGMDYMNNWVANIRNVTRADIKKVAQKRFRPDDMAIVLVGNPDGTAPQESVKKAKPEKAEAEEEPQPVAQSEPAYQPPSAAKKATAPEPENTVDEREEDLVVEEETVAAPVKGAKKAVQPQEPADRSSYRATEAPQKPAPQERKRRNPDSKKWL